MNEETSQALAAQIKEWGQELGFATVRIAPPDLPEAETALSAWLDAGYHGTMNYMVNHGIKRARPQELCPGTRAIIVARMNYWPNATAAKAVLADPQRAYVSRYALGRDYHKVLRQRLQKLAAHIAAQTGCAGQRVFVDSAPVMETQLAANAGLGWRGKHSLLLDRMTGSWFFLGAIYTDLPLPPDPPVSNHCGTCRACINVCPTGAIIAPYRVDARRCISYLTIELKGSIPEEFRPAIGNRIYGCDDCQLYCPWNRAAPLTREQDFTPRYGLDSTALTDLFLMEKSAIAQHLQGTAIARIGPDRWLRNIAVALGNAPTSPAIIAALQARLTDEAELVREHVRWALNQHDKAQDAANRFQ
jgi:epoxyqueuosine reductase